MQANVSIASNRSLAQSLELLFELVKRDLKSKYKNTALGVLWVVIQPLLLALFFILITNKFLANSTEHKTNIILMFTIFILWQFFSTSFQRGAVSIEANGHLIYRIKFPAILLPISVTISAFIDLLVNTSLLFLFLLLVKKTIFVNILFLIPILLISTIFIFALTLIFSILICYFADIRHLVPFLTQISLFGLPILFSENVFPPQIKRVYENIPLVWMVSKTKEVITTSNFLLTDNTIMVILISLVLLSFACLIFKKLERFVVDYI